MIEVNETSTFTCKILRAGVSKIIPEQTDNLRKNTKQSSSEEFLFLILFDNGRLFSRLYWPLFSPPEE